MFNNDIRLYGKHAEILKKYSKDNSDANEYKFILVDNENNQHSVYLFETMIGLFLCAAMIGIIENKKSNADEKKSIYANIMTEQVLKYKKHLNRVYHFMVLTSEGNSVDKKIKDAFTLREGSDDELEKQVYSYAYAGLEIIDELFRNCRTYEDLANELYSFINNYSREIEE